LGNATNPLPRVLPSLTGLRAIAAGLVFLRHTEYLFADTPVSYVSLRLFGQGSIGVSFFYVLSGFVLTWSWKPGILRFFRRRFARIYPAYAVTWLLGGLVALYVGNRVTPGIALATLGLAQAWIPIDDYFIGMNGVSWSLSCEAFFYALFPALIWFLARASSNVRRLTLLLLVLGVIAVPAVVTTWFPGLAVIDKIWATYIFPPTRMLEFGCGVILALEVKSGRWPRVPVPAAVALACAGYLAAGQAGHWHPETFKTYYGYAAVTIVPFIVLIGAYAIRDVAAGKSLMASPLAIRLGELSYSFYLVHFLVIQSFQHATQGWEPRLLPAIVALLSLFVVALSAAWALYRFVEHPAERRLRGSVRSVGLPQARATA
jgi:peptidoglycan/LPS O-acetylase OafA/YrhL